MPGPPTPRAVLTPESETHAMLACVFVPPASMLAKKRIVEYEGWMASFAWNRKDGSVELPGCGGIFGLNVTLVP